MPIEVFQQLRTLSLLFGLLKFILTFYPVNTLFMMTLQDLYVNIRIYFERVRILRQNLNAGTFTQLTATLLNESWFRLNQFTNVFSRSNLRTIIVGGATTFVSGYLFMYPGTLRIFGTIWRIYISQPGDHMPAQVGDNTGWLVQLIPDLAQWYFLVFISNHFTWMRKFLVFPQPRREIIIPGDDEEDGVRSQSHIQRLLGIAWGDQDF